MTKSDATRATTSELEAMSTCADALSTLDHAQRERALAWLNQRFGAASAGSSKPGGGQASSATVAKTAPSDQTTAVKAMSAKDFVISKLPKTEVERVTVLAYFRMHNQGQPTFKTADISALNTEAAQPKLSNASTVTSNATKSSHYFTSADAGTRQLTPLGERIVEAMPDQDAVKAAIEELGRPRRRPPKKAAKKSTA